MTSAKGGTLNLGNQLTATVIADADPGPIGAGVLWIDKSGVPTHLRQRNPADTAWIDLGALGGGGGGWPPPGVFPVTDFGADPTGVADSTAAFNAAIAAALAYGARGGGVVYIAPGAYNLAGTVAFDLVGKTLYLMSFPSAAMFSSTPPNGAAQVSNPPALCFLANPLTVTDTHDGLGRKGTLFVSGVLLENDVSSGITFATTAGGVVNQISALMVSDSAVWGSGAGAPIVTSGDTVQIEVTRSLLFHESAHPGIDASASSHAFIEISDSFLNISSDPCLALPAGSQISIVNSTVQGQLVLDDVTWALIAGNDGPFSYAGVDDIVTTGGHPCTGANIVNNLGAGGGTVSITGTGNTVRGNQNWNPKGDLGAATPAVPLTTVPLSNDTGFDAQVFITAAGGSAVDVALNGTTVMHIAAATSAMVRVPANSARFGPSVSTITLTYPAAAPTWVWIGE